MLVLALLAGCGDSPESASGPRSSGHRAREVPPAVRRVPPIEDRTVGTEDLRRAVLQGAAEDYLSGTQVGPPRFGLCLQLGLRRLLDERELRSLASVYRRPAGQQLTAQALNDLAVPVGDRCGGRKYVPELINASMAFRAGRLAERQAAGSILDGLLVGLEGV